MKGVPHTQLNADEITANPSVVAYGNTIGDIRFQDDGKLNGRQESSNVLLYLFYTLLLDPCNLQKPTAMASTTSNRRSAS